MIQLSELPTKIFEITMIDVLNKLEKNMGRIYESMENFFSKLYSVKKNHKQSKIEKYNI